MSQKVMGEELLNFTSVKKWISSLEQGALSRGKTFTTDARDNRLWHLWHYQCWQNEKNSKLNPDELLHEAQSNIEATMARLTDYFNFQISNNGTKKAIGWNTACTNISFLRGFYTHNDVVFPKRFKSPKPRISEVSKSDKKTEIYEYNEENNETVFQNGTLKHFFDNLNFRDQTIALSLLSTGADSADILDLKIGFVKDGKGKLSTAKRFLFHGNRAKDGIEFKTYFSVEATEYVRRYVEQMRPNAKSSEYLFVKEETITDEKEKSKTKIYTKIPTHALAMNFRAAAEKMGYVVDDASNPFRPKRFRHLFRTACSIANIDNGYVMAMMGHASNISSTYLEKSDGLLLKEYLKVEPYITVYGVDKSQITLMNETVDELRHKNDDVEKELESNRVKIIELYEKQQKDKEKFESDVKSLKDQIGNMYQFVHKNLEPLLDVVDEIASTPEGAELLKKLQDKKQAEIEEDNLHPKVN